MVTKRYEGQRVTSWSQPAPQTNRDPNRDEILARFDQPRASETYRRQDDVLSTNYSFHYLECCQDFRICNYTSYREDCLMCCPPSNKVIKSHTKRFLALGGLHEDKLYDALQAMAPTNVKTVHQTSLLLTESNLDLLGLLSPTHGQRSQQQSGQITLQPVLINKPKFLHATRNTETRKVEIPRFMVVEALSW